MKIDVGETFDRRFLLRREIGRDEVSVLYQAHQLYTQRDVALRLVRPDAPSQAKAKARLLCEAQILGKVDHHGVVGILDAGADQGGEPYVAMQMLEGRLLDGLLATRGALPLDETIELAQQVGGALAAAHDAGVIHGELRPVCIFLAGRRRTTEPGQSAPPGARSAKIIDFGAAALAALREEIRRQGTAAAGVLAPSAYSAPEWTSGSGADHRADIYSLAMLIHELATGEVPRKGELRDGKLAPRILDVLRQAASRSPDDRFDTLDAFFAALRNARAEAPAPPAEEPRGASAGARRALDT